MKRSNRGKRVTHEESFADSFGTRTALDVTPEEMIGEFMLNSVQESSICVVLMTISLVSMVYDTYVFCHRTLIF